MEYMALFVFALMINVVSTLLTRAIAQWDKRSIIAWSLFYEVIAWAPMFIAVKLIMEDPGVAPFLTAVAGGWVGSIATVQIKRLGGT